MPMPALRRIALALGFALVASGALAECRGPSILTAMDEAKREGLAAAVAATPHAEGLLWSARRGDARVLIVGTMHLPDPRHAATVQALRPAVQAADLVLLEVTPAEEAAMAQAIAASPALALLDGPLLSERLSPEAWDRAASAAKGLGLDPRAAARFRPWLLMMALSAPPCASIGLDPEAAGLDRLILRAAQGAQVPVGALEPWDTLFRLFDEEGEARQVAMLERSLLDPAAAEGLLIAMRESYFAGRIAEVWELARLGTGVPGPSGDDAMAALETALLIRRNAAWVPVIEQAATRNPRLLVAAGAAHLPGKAGLLRLLEGRGWTVEPIPAGDCCEGFWPADPAVLAFARTRAF